MACSLGQMLSVIAACHLPLVDVYSLEDGSYLRSYKLPERAVWIARQ